MNFYITVSSILGVFIFISPVAIILSISAEREFTSFTILVTSSLTGSVSVVCTVSSVIFIVFSGESHESVPSGKNKITAK